jgi:hypothetical protein
LSQISPEPPKQQQQQQSRAPSLANARASSPFRVPLLPPTAARPLSPLIP